MNRSANCGRGGDLAVGSGKKTAEAIPIQKEVTREVEQLLRIIFSARRKTGRLDLEAIEMAVRSAMHQAGAAALDRTAAIPSPGCRPADHCLALAATRLVTRNCVPSRFLTAVGKVEVSRPYYLCPHCHTGQFPADVELDIENTEFSPGVRRMQAVVGQAAPFDHGRQQMKLLADLEVTTKAVERTAEAIGEDIAAREQEEIQRAVQLDLPIVIGERGSDPVRANGWDGSAGGEERDRWDAPGKTRWPTGAHTGSQVGMCLHPNHLGRGGLSHSRSGFHHLHRRHRDRRRVWQAHLRGSLEARLEPRRKRKWSWVMEPNGSGTSPSNTFPGAIQIVDLYHARQHLWELARRLHPNDETAQKAWMKVHQRRLLDKGKIEKLVCALRAIDSTNPEVAEKIRIEAEYFERNADAHALPQVPPATPLCRLGSDRSRLQDRDRFSAQAVRHVLDGPRSQRNHRSAMLPPQRSV